MTSSVDITGTTSQDDITEKRRLIADSIGIYRNIMYNGKKKQFKNYIRDQ